MPQRPAMAGICLGLKYSCGTPMPLWIRARHRNQLPLRPVAQMKSLASIGQRGRSKAALLSCSSVYRVDDAGDRVLAIMREPYDGLARCEWPTRPRSASDAQAWLEVLSPPRHDA